MTLRDQVVSVEFRAFSLNMCQVLPTPAKYPSWFLIFLFPLPHFISRNVTKCQMVALKRWQDSHSWSMGSPVIASFPTVESYPIPTITRFFAFCGTITPGSSATELAVRCHCSNPWAGEIHLAENMVLGQP